MTRIPQWSSLRRKSPRHSDTPLVYSSVELFTEARNRGCSSVDPFTEARSRGEIYAVNRHQWNKPLLRTSRVFR